MIAAPGTPSRARTRTGGPTQARVVAFRWTSVIRVANQLLDQTVNITLRYTKIVDRR